MNGINKKDELFFNNSSFFKIREGRIKELLM